MSTKITAMTAAAAASATDLAPVVQGSAGPFKMTMSQIGTFVRALFTTTPATIAEGGTGAATAAGARTNLAVPSTSDIQLQLYTAFTTGGTSTAYTLTPAPALAANTSGVMFEVLFHTPAGATPTLAVSGLTAKNLKYKDALGAKQAVTSLQIPSGWSSFVLYDGTDWLVLNVPQQIPAVGSNGKALIADSVQTTGMAWGYPAIRSYLAGCGMSTAGSSATMSIAAGMCSDSTNVSMMALSAIAKTTSAWAVGTAQGGLDTGTIANATWYHFWVIQRTDTGVVDVLISTSATAPTMPTNYTLKRRIGSGLTNGSAQWILFTQDGDYFRWSASVRDINAANPGTSAVTATLASVPTGINVFALVNANIHDGDNINRVLVYLSDLAASDEAPTQVAAPLGTTGYNYGGLAAAMDSYWNGTVRTNTSAQIRYRVETSTAGVTMIIVTLGWFDRRGRDA